MLSHFLGEEEEDGIDIVSPSTKLSLEVIEKDGRMIRCSNGQLLVLQRLAENNSCEEQVVMVTVVQFEKWHHAVKTIVGKPKM